MGGLGAVSSIVLITAPIEWALARIVVKPGLAELSAYCNLELRGAFHMAASITTSGYCTTLSQGGPGGLEVGVAGKQLPFWKQKGTENVYLPIGQTELPHGIVRYPEKPRNNK